MNPKANAKAPAREAALRQVPAVGEFLLRPRLAELAVRAGHALVLETTRGVLADLRAEFAAAAQASLSAGRVEEVEACIIAEVDRALALSLHPLINATGVVLAHESRPRAAPAARSRASARVAAHYSNLEYDLRARRARQARRPRRLADSRASPAPRPPSSSTTTPPPSFSFLTTLAKGAEVLVSRGELIEIGDGFRIPDIMAESGAVLREVGTTNRTRIDDYERAISDRTRLLLRVHPINFRIVGFTERPSLAELVALGRRAGLPVLRRPRLRLLADLRRERRRRAGGARVSPRGVGPRLLQRR